MICLRPQSRAWARFWHVSAPAEDSFYAPPSSPTPAAGACLGWESHDLIPLRGMGHIPVVRYVLGGEQPPAPLQAEGKDSALVRDPAGMQSLKEDRSFFLSEGTILGSHCSTIHRQFNVIRSSGTALVLGQWQVLGMFTVCLLGRTGVTS